ncbi:hypothetical protein AVEN_221490-1 [Araneus ventricosus]|uniref:Uncharacterized protein n=1 Tax=Araneus ventricosus TaxID=182803 RepID=A0A4Y2E292_ARAVE|nr:hypothetical protein AVEN_221490-1 [Araneus ventricosus]
MEILVLFGIFRTATIFCLKGRFGPSHINRVKPAPGNAWSNPQALAQVKAPSQPHAPTLPSNLTPQLPINQAPLQADLQSDIKSPILNQITSTFLSQLNAVFQSTQAGHHITLNNSSMLDRPHSLHLNSMFSFSNFLGRFLIGTLPIFFLLHSDGVEAWKVLVLK